MIPRQSAPSTMLAVLLCCLLAAWPSTAQSETRANFTGQELYDLTSRFLDALMYPDDVEQTRSINSTLLAEDVVGRVDITGSWQGRELNTEYLFGLFSNIAQGPASVSLVGVSQSYEIIHHVGSGDVAAVSAVVQINYTALAIVLPVELDAWITFNEAGELTQYDATFRWFAWTVDTIAQLLAADSQLGLGTQPGLAAALVSQICTVHEEYCTGSDQQYTSAAECASFLSSIQVGESYQLGFNTLACRSLHIHMLPLRPSVHCPHIGKTGGGLEGCANRDYVSTVSGNPFSRQSFIPEGIAASAS